MLDYYVRYNIITVVPLDSSVYLYEKLPSDIKLSSKLITLNYSSKSPFIKTSILSYKKDQHLFIWFTLKQNYSSFLVVPEGFIVYFILSELGDGLYCLSMKDGKKLVVYIKDGILLLEFFLSDISQLKQIEEQYSLKSYKISYEKYLELYNEVWKNIKFLSKLRYFLSVDLSKEKVWNFFDKSLYYPIVFIMFLYIGISSYQAYFMQKEIDALSQTYHKLKEKNSKLKYSIREHNQQVEQLSEFAKKELSYQDPIKILVSLDKVMHKGEDAKIKFLTISPMLMKINIQTKADAIKYFRRLNELKYFKDITIEGTYKHKNGEKIYIYSISLKALD